MTDPIDIGALRAHLTLDPYTTCEGEQVNAETALLKAMPALLDELEQRRSEMAGREQMFDSLAGSRCLQELSEILTMWEPPVPAIAWRFAEALTTIFAPILGTDKAPNYFGLMFDRGSGERALEVRMMLLPENGKAEAQHLANRELGRKVREECERALADSAAMEPDASGARLLSLVEARDPGFVAVDELVCSMVRTWIKEPTDAK